MATERERAAFIGYLVFAIPLVAIGFWIANTGPTTDPPDYTTPSEPAVTWTPEPPVSIPDSPSSAQQDCGDGTEGTWAECWQRAHDRAVARLRTAWPTPSTPVTVPSLAPPALTVCADGSISHSTGSGTCSWHGGIG
jgi:hypothetical protein